MHSYLIAMVLKTMPHIDINQYEDNKIVFKPRNQWKEDCVKFVLLFLVFSAIFFLLSEIRYIGPLFFLIGFLGMIMSIGYSLRAFFVYKNYDEIFSKQNIEKMNSE